MSLTTVAAEVLPDRHYHSLPESRPERFQRSDFIAAAIVFLVTLAVYIITLSPSVTLEDSGELITGAAKFGVPHPPGYPLWTISGYLLSTLLPIGSLAWRVNLESALFGAAANMILALLVCHSGRWLLQRWTVPELQPMVRKFSFYAGLLAGFTIGFSDVMWSQAVIAEVYTLNALFVNLVLLTFYLWMLEPQKTHRLLLAVFVFALGLTNHHTLVQMIPAFLVAALLVEFTPALLGKPQASPMGTFFSVFLAVNLFSLTILVYISWLSGDIDLQVISNLMAWIILITTAGVSFFYLKEFHLRRFLIGTLIAVAVFAYGHYFLTPSEGTVLRHGAGSPFYLWGTLEHPGWMQITTKSGLALLGMAIVTGGLLFSSTLNWRMILGVCIVGWIGLSPYAYERVASATNPPMNWGFASERAGFYYAVSREQYPKSLPTLIKTTFGKAIGVVKKDAQLDTTIGQPDYLKRLAMTFYLYGYDLQDNFTVPLIFLTAAMFLYIRRSDWPQANWLIFLAVAFFFLGFMLQLLAPQERFDFQSNQQYKVFHLQSHCIFVILMGYGALAAMTYAYETVQEYSAKIGLVGIGGPALFLSLLPLWSNFNDCSMAGHWFGYNYGADMMRNMDKNAVYFGGSDAGRFVPTFMAFVESQQSDYWKHEPGFDRRDVAVITQNALCDSFYGKYIRNHYDNRFRPLPDGAVETAPTTPDAKKRPEYTPFEKWLGRDKAYPIEQVICLNDQELLDCWDEYQEWPEVKERMRRNGPVLRAGTNDVFDVNGIVAKRIFEKNKDKHTFYVEQSIPIQWMYPYLRPYGLIFKLNPTPLDGLTPEEVAADLKYWDDYSQKLLVDPKFRLDEDAVLNFAKLAFWHADLYRYRQMDVEQEHLLRIVFALCPQLPDGVNNLTRLLAQHQKYEEAIEVAKEAYDADPFNTAFLDVIVWLKATRAYGKQEGDLKSKLQTSPYDLGLNLQLARIYQEEGRYNELNERLNVAAGLTNWTQPAMADMVRYYVDEVRNPMAAITFLEARARVTPKESEMVYNLAALHATLNHQADAMRYLIQAELSGGTNVVLAAKADPRFEIMRNNPAFQAFINKLDQTNAPPSNTPAAEKKPAQEAAPVSPKKKEKK